MIPWLKLAAVAAVLATAFGGGWTVRGWRAADAELERQQAEAKIANRQAETALRASQQLEADREAIRRQLVAARAERAAALAAPVPQCPALAVGDVVVPDGALRGLRRAAGQPVGADAGQPRPAVPARRGDPGG